jgi:hypothetical protein
MSNPFDALSEEQKLRLSNLQSTFQYDRITVSFSLDSRVGDFKKSAFYSASVSRADDGVSPKGWGPDEIQLVRLMLSKQVVLATYEDALRRRMVTKNEVSEELSAIMSNYDQAIVRLASNTGDHKT